MYENDLPAEEIVDNFALHESDISLEYFTVTEIMMETYQKLYALLRYLHSYDVQCGHNVCPSVRLDR